MQTGVNRPRMYVGESARALNGDAFIAIIPLFLYSCFSFGARALLLTVVSVSAAVGAQALCELMMLTRPRFCFTPVITGLIIALLSPVTAPYWLVALGSVFAIAVVKMPFGGLGRNPFNPAAAGWCFMVICASGRMFAYPGYKYGLQIPLFGNADSLREPSLAAMLREGTLPNANGLEILLGRVTGPMGTTAVLLLITCGIYLVYRRTITWHMPVAFVSACAVFAFVFPRLSIGRIWSAAIELSAGSLLFCAVILLTDPVTSPKLPWTRVVYGALAGILTMLLRYFGVFEQGAPFAIMLMNAFAPSLDTMGYNLRKGGILYGKRR